MPAWSAPLPEPVEGIGAGPNRLTAYFHSRSPATKHPSNPRLPVHAEAHDTCQQIREAQSLLRAMTRACQPSLGQQVASYGAEVPWRP